MSHTFAALLGLVSMAVPETPGPKETRIAVLPIQAKDGVTDKQAELITDVFTAEIAKQRPDLKVTGTAELRTMITFEQQKSLLGCSDDSCLAEVGAALGVDAIASGSVGMLGDVIVLNLVLIDQHTARVIKRHTETLQDQRGILKVMPYVTGVLMSGIPGGTASPARPGEAPGSSTPKDGTAAATGQPRPATADDAKSGTSGGGSSLPRRLAGVGVAGVGALVLGAGLGLGLGSVAWLLLGRGIGGLSVPLGGTPLKYVGGGVALAGDLSGILGVILLGVGVVVAVLP